MNKLVMKIYGCVVRKGEFGLNLGKKIVNVFFPGDLNDVPKWPIKMDEMSS